MHTTLTAPAEPGAAPRYDARIPCTGGGGGAAARAARCAGSGCSASEAYRCRASGLGAEARCCSTYCTVLSQYLRAYNARVRACEAVGVTPSLAPLRRVQPAPARAHVQEGAEASGPRGWVGCPVLSLP
jgi:hypothetical protein